MASPQERKKPALPWLTALRIAARELVFARVKFIFVVLSVAIGVGALTGVRGFADSFSTTLLGQARSILAADLTAKMTRTLRPEELERLDRFAAKAGAQMTQVTEMASMAGVEGDPVPLLVSLKVIDPNLYPFYGNLKLSPAQPLSGAIGDHSVVVDESLLVRLHTQVGAMLRIGGQPFRISALIMKEPDRLTAGVGIGPRVMMTRHAVEAIGLLQPGSRSSRNVPQCGICCGPIVENPERRRIRGVSGGLGGVDEGIADDDPRAFTLACIIRNELVTHGLSPGAVRGRRSKFVTAAPRAASVLEEIVSLRY